MQPLTPPGVVHRTKQEFAYQVLRGAIIRCELAPGERLVTKRIAQWLGISYITVREALQLLQVEGLVESVPHTGAMVARISRESVLEVFTVKEGLETVATRVAAQRANPEDLESLQGILGQMDEVLQSGEYERWGDLNTSFHAAISDVSAMPTLREMSRRVLDQWDRIRRYFFSEVLVHRLVQSQQEHRAMVSAIRDHNPEAAERLAREHNQNALEDYMQRMSENAEEKAT